MTEASGSMSPTLNWAAALNIRAPPGSTTDRPGEYQAGALGDAHAAVADGAREAYEVAEEAGDVASASLFEELALCREKDAWHLRAYCGASLTEEPAET